MKLVDETTHFIRPLKMIIVYDYLGIGLVYSSTSSFTPERIRLYHFLDNH